MVTENVEQRSIVKKILLKDVSMAALCRRQGLMRGERPGGQLGGYHLGPHMGCKEPGTACSLWGENEQGG